MSAREFVSWQAYWDEHPFDNDALYFRPYALMLSLTAKDVDYDAAMRWMKRKADPLSTYTQGDLNTFAALGLKPPGR